MIKNIENKNRYGKKWSINEILKLQREFELLELNVLQIAKLHQRSEESIVYKLIAEGFKRNLVVNKKMKREIVVNNLERMQLRSRSYK